MITLITIRETKIRIPYHCNSENDILFILNDIPKITISDDLIFYMNDDGSFEKIESIEYTNELILKNGKLIKK